LLASTVATAAWKLILECVPSREKSFGSKRNDTETIGWLVSTGQIAVEQLDRAFELKRPIFQGGNLDVSHFNVPS
jgi:hypothetical protein